MIHLPHSRSYLNNVPTSTLEEINQGIMAKEEQMRRHEAELRLHHAWRLRQPELRATNSYVANGKLKSAWLDYITKLFYFIYCTCSHVGVISVRSIV